MFKKIIFTVFLLFGTFITIYPSKKENTNLFDYCYSLEKILSSNLLEISRNTPMKVKILAKDISLFGTNKTKGALANRIIDQYKTSKKLFIITVVPNKLYCLAGYWIEEIYPGTLTSIFYEKSKQKINKYRDLKDEVDGLINDINSEYKSIQKEIKNIF